MTDLPRYITTAPRPSLFSLQYTSARVFAPTSRRWHNLGKIAVGPQVPPRAGDTIRAHDEISPNWLHQEPPVPPLPNAITELLVERPAVTHRRNSNRVGNISARVVP